MFPQLVDIEALRNLCASSVERVAAPHQQIVVVLFELGRRLYWQGRHR